MKLNAIRVSYFHIAQALLAVSSAIVPLRAQEIQQGLENAYRYAPTDYMSTLRDANIQGKVTAEVLVDTDGFPIEARIVEGPMNQLRRQVLRSLMDWRWARPELARQTVRVVIDFKLGKSHAPNPVGLFKPGPRPAGLSKSEKRGGVVETIDMTTLRPRLRHDLAEHLPIREGQRVEGTEWPAVQSAVKAIDEWLDLKLEDGGTGTGAIPRLALRISYPNYQSAGVQMPPPPPPPPPPAPRK